MKNLRAKVLMAAAALCGSLGLGLVTHAAPAAAAPVTIAGCPTSTGSTDTAEISVTVDDTLFAGGALVPLHDRVGVQAGGFYNGVAFSPTAADNAMSTPVCGVQRSAGGAVTYQWLYCTDEPLNACGNAPWLKNADAPQVTLTNLDKARLAYVLDNVITQPLAGGGVTEASNRTAATRGQRQRLIWCVASHVAAGAPAPSYLGAFEQALTCPDWTAIDPTLNTNPQVALTGPAASVAAGQAQTFTLTTNISPLTITAAGIDSVSLCPAAQAGVTLAAGVLTVADASAGRTVTLCGVKTSAGSGSLTASIAQLSASTLQFWQRPTDNGACQGMLSTEVVQQPGATATAPASWLEILTSTTTPSTTISPTTVVRSTTTTDPATTTTFDVLETTIVNNITLPRTGAGSTSSAGYLGLVLLLVGGVLVFAGRRGGEPTD